MVAGSIRVAERPFLALQAAVEVLTNKMKAVRQEVASQAASAALLHKFNSGATEPTGEVTRQRLTQGIMATKEVQPPM